MTDRPIIGITLGDPASIGPEIVVKSLASAEIYELCRPLLIGDSRVVERAMTSTGVTLNINPVANPSEGRFALGAIDLIDLQNVDIETLEWGKVQAQAGQAAFEYIVRSIELAKAGEID
ncbi:MAG: pyridoxine phosphate biosynthetic protein, partial [Firmicutes bacterium]|nr:pyridoxine phosphate biosynthetic protein [Bacillota bacterium]